MTFIIGVNKFKVIGRHAVDSLARAECDGAVMSGGGASAGAVVRHGHLRKLKTMKKKFFVLRAETLEHGARLEYYESEKKFRAGALPRRSLPLKGCYNIMRRLDLKQRHVIALFTREEQFCIVAENETELHGWLSAILTQHRSDEASEELLHPIRKCLLLVSDILVYIVILSHVF